MHESQNISVRVLESGRRASVHIPPGFDLAHLTVALLRTIATDAKVQFTADVERRLTAIADDYKANPRDLVTDIAHATEPAHGSDGLWTWEPGFDPAATAKADAADGQSTNHYASHIVSVVAGTPVARIRPPTAGNDGRSVTGAVLPARPGRPARPRAGEGLQIRPDGVVAAARDGVLHVSADDVSVSPVLEIKGCVDFTTGQIDFKGDVVVADAVRDGFQIRASGNIAVRGPVEGATIACKGSFVCPHGVASSRRAKVFVDGDANVGYLRNVSAVFKGNLTCRSEAQHSDIIVGGELHCESGRVIGGSVSLTGTARIGTLGSPEWAPTAVSVGGLPLVATELHRLGAEAARVEKAAAAKEELRQHLQCSAAGKSAAAREQLTELQYELSELCREAAEIEKKRAALQEMMGKGQRFELHVLRVVYPRVRIQCGKIGYEFERELKGPLQFLLDEHGAVLVRVSTLNPRPITEFAHAVLAAPTSAAAADTAKKAA